MKIRIHWSVIFFAILFCLEGAVRYYKETGLPFYTIDPILVGVIVAAGVFLSIFLHEVFHYLAAKKIGLKVENLTIHLLGGYVKTDMNEIDNSKDYTIMSGAGLIANIIVISWLWLALLFIETPLVYFAFLVLIEINILLLLLNAIPMCPLDGWRLVYGIAWMINGDKKIAERFAHKVAIPSCAIAFVASIFYSNAFLVAFTAFSMLGSIVFFLPDDDKMQLIVFPFSDTRLVLDVNNFIEKIKRVNPPFLAKRKRELNSIAVAMYFLQTRSALDDVENLKMYVKNHMSFLSMNDIIEEVREIESWFEIKIRELL